VIESTCGNVNQRDVARESAVIPPVRIECRDAISETCVIDSDHNEVLTGINVEEISQSNCGKATIAAADLLSVYPYD
jgi:hypothetical protein